MSVAIDNSNDPQLERLLLDGSVGVLPTDTLYGLVCRAADQSAVERLYRVKHREGKPGTVIAASMAQLIELGLKARYVKAAEQFWPGAVSVILPAEPSLAYLDQGLQSLAVRVVGTVDLRNLLDKTGPLLTTSVNQPGLPPAVNLEEAKNYFGDSIDFYVDGGDLSGNQPSTLVRVIDDAVDILRQGAVRV